MNPQRPIITVCSTNYLSDDQSFNIEKPVMEYQFGVIHLKVYPNDLQSVGKYPQTM